MAIEVAQLGLDCHRCEENPELQRHRGCKVPTERVQHILRDGTKLYRCPSKMIRQDVRIYIDLYYDYAKTNRLPFRGTRLEQPIKILEIFDIIDRHKHKLNDEKDQLLKRMNEAQQGIDYGKRK